jgi:hypothetical protein
MKKVFGITLSLLLPILGSAQQWELSQEVILPPSDLFGVDQFGSIYTVQGNEIRKHSEEGEQIYSYANPVLGDIYEIDLLNPLAPYLFFRDANQMVVLDNRLNDKGQLNFNDLHFIDVQLISFSDQENVWVYDQANDRIYRLNIRSRAVTNQSLTITQIVDAENRPTAMVSSIDKVYLNIPGEGIYIFDATGAFSGIIPLKEVSLFDVEGKLLIAVIRGQLTFYNLTTGNTESWDPELGDIRDLRLFNSRLYLFDGSKLRIYQAHQNE